MTSESDAVFNAWTQIMGRMLASSFASICCDEIAKNEKNAFLRAIFNEARGAGYFRIKPLPIIGLRTLLMLFASKEQELPLQEFSGGNTKYSWT
jgi:hypothetical protein